MMLAKPFSSTMASSQHDSFGTSEIADKIMRRIEVAKVARNLQDCLAFASFKAQNGWQDRTLRSIEPEIAEQLKRKRPHTEDMLSDDSDDLLPHGTLQRSNTTSFKVPNQAYTSSRKRVRSASATAVDTPVQFPGNWKQHSGLPQSSPALAHTHFEHPTLHHDMEDSPMFDAPSDEEDTGPRLEPSSSIISTSPPRTPPPTRRRLNDTKQSGADLLLYLANSPSRSPAINVTHISSSSKPPSTPPQHNNLPSSMMNTPGNSLGLFNGALTPMQNFNLADYCNFSPSPAQPSWGGRTPGLTKTPARLGRSASDMRKGPTSQGLALQLGDELPR